MSMVKTNIKGLTIATSDEDAFNLSEAVKFDYTLLNVAVYRMILPKNLCKVSQIGSINPNDATDLINQLKIISDKKVLPELEILFPNSFVQSFYQNPSDKISYFRENDDGDFEFRGYYRIYKLGEKNA